MKKLIAEYQKKLLEDSRSLVLTRSYKGYKHGIGYDGMTMSLTTAKDLEKPEAYQKRKSDLKLFSALCHIDYSKPADLKHDHFRKVGLADPADGGHVVERLVYFNDDTREFSYKTTDLIDCRFPLGNYQAFLRLDANSCRLRWGSVFTVEGATEKEGGDLIKIIYQGGDGGIRRVLG